MTREEVLTKLCGMMGKVWDAIDPFAHNPCDCICRNKLNHYQNSGEALEFMQKAIDKAIAEYAVVTPSASKPLTGAELAEKHGFEPVPDWKKDPFVRPMRIAEDCPSEAVHQCVCSCGRCGWADCHDCGMPACTGIGDAREPQRTNEATPRRPTLTEIEDYLERRKNAAAADEVWPAVGAYDLALDFVRGARFDVPRTDYAPNANEALTEIRARDQEIERLRTVIRTGGAMYRAERACLGIPGGYEPRQETETPIFHVTHVPDDVHAYRHVIERVEAESRRDERMKVAAELEEIAHEQAEVARNHPGTTDAEILFSIAADLRGSPTGSEGT